MMDKLEQETFQWFEGLIETFGQLVLDLEALFTVKNKAWKQDMEFTRRIIYEYSPDALFIGRHYLQAIKMRTLAIKEGNFTWYCASTYALCHDWKKVQESIPWLEWGASALLGDSMAQMAVIVVAACQPTEDDFKRVLQGWGQDADHMILDLEQRGLVEKRRWRGGEYNFYPGPRAPQPMETI